MIINNNSNKKMQSKAKRSKRNDAEIRELQNFLITEKWIDN